MRIRRNRNYRAAKKAKLLSDKWREKLSPKVAEIHLLLGRESKGRVEIGEILIDIKAGLHDGQWLEWLKEELRVLSIPTVENYMRIAHFCAGRGIVDFTNLPLSSLIDLSRKQNTHEQIEAALAEAEKGPVPHKRMKELLKRPKPKPEPEPERKPEPEPEPKPSGKPVMTKDDIGVLRDLLRQHLMDNPDLYEKVMTAVKERGVRLQLVGKSGPLNILEIDELLAPFDPASPPVPDWVKAQGQSVPAYAA
ncbi:hypothetical protein [Mesorhizobium wenxiniae]|uniref:DUF3102 domain-containing protein n=1 Tax=Mesorhizobium wenxiniae TaxID=2014805 RepID=A0A271K8T7_9HYPH|nr:hypothetical protein [Mesorhizobium wenxiniae]PAP91389.1 hypothetical protein CIT31_32455 [Mesorhizobium wenxiniae]